KPDMHMNLPLPDVHAATGIEKSAFTLKKFIYHVVPASVIEALAHDEILKIVEFTLFFGVTTASIGEKGHLVVQAFDAISQVILKVTSAVMRLAPLAVFGAMTAVIAKQGPGILKTYSLFIGEFYGGLALLWICLIAAGGLFIG